MHPFVPNGALLYTFVPSSKGIIYVSLLIILLYLFRVSAALTSSKALEFHSYAPWNSCKSFVG